MILLSLMLIFCTVLTFVSCGGGETPTECTEHKDENGDGICDTEGCGKAVETKPTPSADVFNENGELYLFKSGVPTFQFVIGSDALAKQKANVDDLAETLSDLCVNGTEIKVVAQGEETQEVEIIIGTVTNRGDEYKINKYDYGTTGYTVKQIGTKIVVTGGSDNAMTSAINHLKNNVFGIKKNNDDFTDFVMSAEKAYDVKRNNYTLKEITVANNSIKDYVITYPKNDSSAETNAENFQKNLYEKCGIYLELMLESRAADKLKVAFRTLENDGEGGGYYVTVDDNKNLNIECEYENRSVELTTKFFNENFFNKKNTYAIPEDYEHAPNYRDIYYKDYAKGDGITDDFFALKEVHRIANENLLNVHADPNQTYYIGNANGSETITVKTNTYFHGCSFIFDDEKVAYDSPGRLVPIFTFARDTGVVTYNQSNSPVKSLTAGQTNIGWAPGHTMMLVIYNKNVRHYIRYGANASQNPDPSTWGQDQHELIIVDKDGNVDPSTPIQWTYETVTKLEAYNVDDRPIEIRGEGENGKYTTVTTWYNEGPGAYFYYSRNFYISRSNMVISGIHHIIDKFVPHAEGGNNSPYAGFTQVRSCNNVILENFIFVNPEVYYDTDPDIRPGAFSAPTGANMGSYDLEANLANNVIWRNCTQSNFFEPDGTVVFKGNMGTNFCKNLTFDNMFNCSFDAHCGVYNGTIKNSTLEHVNYIGAGTITYENVTIYADGSQHAAINLRSDYGSTWSGDVIIDGLTIKHHADTINATVGSGGVRLINATWTNWFFGYTTYVPQNISVKNLLTESYRVDIVNGERVEKHVSYNEFSVAVFATSFNNATADYYRDALIAGVENRNHTVPTKKIEFFTEYTGKYADLKITRKPNLVLPAKQHSSGYTMFKDTEYWIDGVLQ